MRRRLNLAKQREIRPILTDVLPFEVPPGFNNGGYFSFLRKCKPRLVTVVAEKEGKTKEKVFLDWIASDERLDAAISFVLQTIPNLDQVQTYTVKTDGPDIVYRRLAVSEFQSRNQAYHFDITHKQGSFRRLSVPHPTNQFLVANFYDKYSSEIIYNCSISPYSIRKPAAIAQTSFFNDRVHLRRLSQIGHAREESHKEYEYLGSYFRYDRYSNVYRFYESKFYHSAERKFDKLLRLDIAKCFDSIYTHSLPWSVLSKDAEKDAIVGKATTSRTFGSQFDKLMQNMNDGETNGILIGPEVSRIFAEIILQRIDRNVEKALREGVGANRAMHKIDYEAFRYVDDYFVFYNDESVADTFQRRLEYSLKTVKLSLSSEKHEKIEKPIITKETIAKNKIRDVLSVALKPERVEVAIFGEEVVTVPVVSVKSNKLIVNFKTALKESGTSYSGLLNFTLSNIEWRTSSWLKAHKAALLELQKHGATEKLSEQVLCGNLEQLIEFCFFIYSTTPKVNFSVRLSRILCLIVDEVHSVVTEDDAKQGVLKAIADNLIWCLRKYTRNSEQRIEALYLLLVNLKLGREHRYTEAMISEFLGASIDEASGRVTFPRVDVFTVDVCLLYIRRRARYDRVRAGLLEAIENLFRERSHEVRKSAELNILFLDLSTCPFLRPSEKQSLSRAAGLNENFMRDVGRAHSHWFIDWTGFDLTLELDKKRAREVY